MKSVKTIFVMLALTLAVVSCEKDKHVPPNVSLQSGAGYISSDATVAQDTTLTVGFVAEKTEDELKTFNVSHAYDGATTTTSDTTIALTSAEADHYEYNYSLTTRNQAGTEKWIFTITDRDGNIAQKAITLTVQ